MKRGTDNAAASWAAIKEAAAVTAAELAAQDGHKVDIAAFRQTLEGWAPPAGCHITKITTEKCGGTTGGIVIYQLVNAKVSRSPLRAGGGHCTDCVNGYRTCYEYECEPQVK